jgi:hypothetical protein
MHGKQHQIKIPFHHYGLTAGTNTVTVLVQPEKKAAFVKNQTLRRIHILGLTVTKYAAAKSNHPAGHIQNRKENTIPESVVPPSPVIFDRESGPFNIGDLQLLLLQAGGDKTPTRS